MKWRNRHRRVVAGVLLTAFLSVFLVKGFHTHGDAPGTCSHSCRSHDKENGKEEGKPVGSQHSHDHCLVCHFFFSPFIASATAGIDPVQMILSIHPVDVVQDVACAAFYSFNLRAPPVTA